MRIISWLVSVFVLSIPLAAQQINPTNQIKWPLSTGTVAPTAPCSASNYGQPYTDYIHNVPYVCTASGWSSGSGASGVTKINGTAGAFTFSGTGVVCVGTTCTFTVGGGGIGTSTPGWIPYYNSTTSINGDPFLSDGATINATTGVLSYTGPNGSSFTTSFGGSYNFSTNNSTSTPTAPASQINLSTTLNQLSTPTTNAGNINLTATDSTGNSGASNINIVTSAPATGGYTNNANILIHAGGDTDGTNSGTITLNAAQNVAITGRAVNILGGNVDGGSVNIQSQFGQDVNLDGSGAGNLVSTMENFTLNDAGDLFFTGNLLFDGTLTVPSLAGTATNCVYTDAAGLFHTTGAACGAGGGGGISGLTAGHVPLAGSSTTLTANSHLDEVTAAGFDYFSQGVIVNDSSGVGGGVTGTEGTVASPGAGLDTFYADATSHRWKQNPNNAGAFIVPGVATAGTSGDCVKFASNGIDLVDYGAGCGVTSVPGTPTLVADGGAGTGGSLVLTLVSGSNDDNGWIDLTTGNSPTGTNSGIITVKFGGTYGAVRKCSVTPASTLVVQLGTNGPYVPHGTATSSQFVITGGPTALPANTTGYSFFYRCGN